MQPLFAYNALIWKNTITILTLILFAVLLVRGLYLFAVLGKHLLKSNQGFQYQQQARKISKLFLPAGGCPWPDREFRSLGCVVCVQKKKVFPYMKSSVYYCRVLQNDRRMNNFKALLVCGLLRS